VRLDNRTHYDTAALRSLLCAVHTGEAGHRGRLRTWDTLVVRIRYRRQGNRKYTGHAFLNGRKSVLSVPRGQLDILEFAALWRHELWHLYGLRHRDYTPTVLYCKPESVVGMVEPGTLVEVAPTKKVVSPDDERTARVKSLVDRLKRWESKRKRAETAITKIRRSLRYYERQIPVSSIQPSQLNQRKPQSTDELVASIRERMNGGTL